MNEKSFVLKLIGLGFHQALVGEEVSYDDLVTIINGLPKSGEKIELSAEEIKSMVDYALELLLKRAKMLED